MTLEEIRVEIDAVDTEMKPLFLRRMECSRQVAEAKEKSGGDVYVPEREKVVIGGRSSDCLLYTSVPRSPIAFSGRISVISSGR